MIDWRQRITKADRMAESEQNARTLRDMCIASSMWILERHRGQTELGCETSITNAQYSDLLTYHQALRDWTTQQGWPDIEMPPKPAWLETT